MASVTLGGNPITVAGNFPQKGAMAWTSPTGR